MAGAKVVAGEKTHKKYRHVALEEAVGKTVEAVARTGVGGAWGEEPCVMLLFSDGTGHGFVLPAGA